MRAIHRRAALVLVVGLVFVSACEPLDGLLGAFGSEEDPGDVVATEDLEATPTDDDAEGPAESEGSAEQDEPEGPVGDATDEQDEAVEVDEDQPVATEIDSPCDADDTRLDAELPVDAERIEQTVGDLTGDGMQDEVITYAMSSGDATTYYLRVVTGSGYVVERQLEDASDLAPVQPLGAAALGGDREVAFVLESAGASGFNIALFGLHDLDDEPCPLLPVTIADHTVARQFTIGGTVGASSGLGCAEVGGTPALTVTQAERSSDGGYEWTRAAYHWPDAGELRFADDDVAAIPEGEDVPGVGILDCPGMTLP